MHNEYVAQCDDHLWSGEKDQAIKNIQVPDESWVRLIKEKLRVKGNENG